MSIAPIISNDEDLYLGSVIVTMRSVGYPISESSRGAIEKAIRRAAAEEKVARLRAFENALWSLRRDLGRILADLDANPAVSPCAEASS